METAWPDCTASKSQTDPFTNGGFVFLDYEVSLGKLKRRADTSLFLWSRCVRRLNLPEGLRGLRPGIGYS